MSRNFTAASLVFSSFLTIVGCSSQLVHDGSYSQASADGGDLALPALRCVVTVSTASGLDDDPAVIGELRGAQVYLTSSAAWLRQALDDLGFQGGRGAPGSVRLQLDLSAVEVLEERGLFPGTYQSYGPNDATVEIGWAMVVGDVTTNGSTTGSGRHVERYDWAADLALRDALLDIRQMANVACDGATPDL